MNLTGHPQAKKSRRSVWTAAANVCVITGAVGITAANLDQNTPPPRATVAGTVPTRFPPGSLRPPPPSDGMRRSVPTGVSVPAVGLRVSLQPVALSGTGDMPLPDDPNRAAWLETSVTPGERGTAVLAGHVDSDHGPAAFYNLSAVKPGMSVTVKRADGSTARFTIKAVAVYPKDHFPSTTVYTPTADPSLRLITCTGWDEDTRVYRDNLVVYATAQPQPH